MHKYLRYYLTKNKVYIDSIDHAEVNGTVCTEDYSHLSKSVFKKPLSKLTNRLLARMYEMNLISDANENSFQKSNLIHYIFRPYINIPLYQQQIQR